MGEVGRIRYRRHTSNKVLNGFEFSVYLFIVCNAHLAATSTSCSSSSLSHAYVYVSNFTPKIIYLCNATVRCAAADALPSDARVFVLVIFHHTHAHKVLKGLKCCAHILRMYMNVKWVKCKWMA